MSEHRNEPVLPSPAKLYRQVGEVVDRIEELRTEVARLTKRYRQLAASPEALAVDDLGEPITAVEANDSVLNGLELADADLQAGAEWLNTTRARHASRLKLTDTAGQQREQRLRAQQRGRTR
ncbi:hypothetical protein DFR70_103685 [Nocardia tenerifensis]|uniref:PE family protein n=1 Tax=Nocardia tenerifensis TaxID=228006 RepID=A0A318K644_9NOCA|nr:hypothetical protein [Nocardia tenerifensis]PXX66930.1 hypothetical protein DFR70_103685 [Nocardia tenerifensis]